MVCLQALIAEQSTPQLYWQHGPGQLCCKCSRLFCSGAADPLKVCLPSVRSLHIDMLSCEALLSLSFTTMSIMPCKLSPSLGGCHLVFKTQVSKCSSDLIPDCAGDFAGTSNFAGAEPRCFLWLAVAAPDRAAACCIHSHSGECLQTMVHAPAAAARPVCVHQRQGVPDSSCNHDPNKSCRNLQALCDSISSVGLFHVTSTMRATIINTGVHTIQSIQHMFQHHWSQQMQHASVHNHCNCLACGFHSTAAAVAGRLLNVVCHSISWSAITQACL